jgi:hypothetical protein
MGKAGAARIEQHFRWSRSAKQMLAIYQELLYRYRASSRPL